MKRLNPGFRSLFLLGFFLCLHAVANAANVTLNVFRSDGTPLQGISTYYGAGVTLPFGTTSASGSVVGSVPNGALYFIASKGGSSVTVNAIITGDTVINLYTSKVNIGVKSSAGSPLSGSTINVSGSSTYTAGTTGANGLLELELFPGSFGVTAIYNGTSKTASVAVGGTGLTQGIVTNFDFYTTEVAANVRTSEGNPLPNVQLSYLSGYFYYPGGSTTASGLTSVQLFPGSFIFKANYRGSSAFTLVNVGGDGVTPSNSTPVNFYTTKVTSTVKSCDNVLISDAAITYLSDLASFTVGTTGSTGVVTNELFPGTFDYKAIYKGTVGIEEDIVVGGTGLAPGATTSVEFTPTAVNLGASGITYQVGYFQVPANGTVYMFAGNYVFTFSSGHTLNLDINGCSKNLTVNILVLKDHNGNPLQGGTARGGLGANYSSYHVAGGQATNQDGVIFDVRNNTSGTMSYEMRFNNTTKVLTQDIAASNVFNFQTNLLTLKLETCNGAPLAGGTARWGHGATSTSSYFPGANITDGNGEMSAEFFPGTYSYEMNYQSSKEVKGSVSVPDANHTLTWKTTNVTLNWAGVISYGGSGDQRYFNKPSMELLPGSLNFNFRTPGNNYKAIDIQGCSMNLTPGLITLVSSTNAPIAGGTVEGYQGGWSVYGTTNANGKLVVVGVNPSSIRMILEGGSQQLNGINLGSSPIVAFQTKLVTMELKNAAGSYGFEGENLQYYANGWRQFGVGSTSGSVATMEMLPANYSFSLTYKGKSQQISNQNVGLNSTVTYQTTPVNVTLHNENNNPISGALASYYANGWYDIGYTTLSGIVSTELLPGSYSFRMVHAAKAKQKDGVAIANPGPNTVAFEYNTTINNWAKYSSESDPEKALLLEVFPNPASNKVSLKFNSDRVKPTTLRLTDLSGKLLINKTLTVVEGPNSAEVRLDHLPNGIYMLLFDNGDVQELSKIVVRH